MRDKPESEFRDLLPDERLLLERLLSVSFPERDIAAVQLESARARVVDEDGSLEFLVESNLRIPRISGVIVEGEARTDEGVLVHALLHVSDGRVKELEFYQEAEGPLGQRPRAADWDVFAMPKR